MVFNRSLIHALYIGILGIGLNQNTILRPEQVKLPSGSSITSLGGSRIMGVILDNAGRQELWIWGRSAIEQSRGEVIEREPIQFQEYSDYERIIISCREGFIMAPRELKKEPFSNMELCFFSKKRPLSQPDCIRASNLFSLYEWVRKREPWGLTINLI